MPDSEQYPTQQPTDATPPNSEQSSEQSSKQSSNEARTIPIAPANNYLLLFAIVLPFALSSIFELLNLDIESVAGLLQLKLLSFGILLICLVPYAKSLFRTARFRNKPVASTVLWALLYNFLAVVGTNLFIQAFFPGWLEHVPSFTPSGNWDVFLLPIALAIIVPLEEELVFRGILLGSYERLLSPRNAFFAVSAFFALVHVVPAQIIVILPTCFLITRAVQVSNSIWTGVIIHMVINGIASAGMLVEPLLPTPNELESIPTATGVSPVVGLLGLCLTATMMWIAYRNWGLASKEKPVEGNANYSSAKTTKEHLWTMSLIMVVAMCALGLIFIMSEPIV